MLQRTLNYINIFGFIWVFITCIFHFVDYSYWFTYGGLYLFCTTWCIEFVIEKRWRDWTMSREKYFSVLLLLFFVLGLCYYPWDGTLYFKHHIELRYPLLGVGIIGLFGVNRLYNKQLIFRTMAVVSVSIVMFLYIKCGIHNLITSPDRINILAEMRRQYVNAHMGFNYYLDATLIGIWYLLFHSGEERRWMKALLVCSGLIIFSALFLSDGRSGLGMGIIITLALIVYEVWSRSRIVAIAILIAGIMGSSIILTNHPRISNQSIRNELRFCYWHSALDLIKDRPILGYGISNAQEQFDEVNMRYIQKENEYFWRVVNTHYVDSHNQYLQTMLEFGLVGLLFLLTIYLSPIWLSEPSARVLTIALSALSMGQSMVDVFLTGQFAMIYCMLMLCCLRVKDNIEAQSENG